MRAKLIQTIDEAEHIRTFRFKPEAGYHYTAGQFAEWKLPHDESDERGIKRWFTLSSSPKDGYISLTTRFASQNGSSFKKALREMIIGDYIEVSQPMGDFVLPKLLQTPLIFVAGGIGITPFHSILTWLAQTGEDRPIKMLYAVNNEDDIIFEETFKKAAQHVTVAVNQPTASWGGERGLLTADMILGVEKPDENTLIYVSGPETMVENLEKNLHAKGIKSKQLVLDFFPNYPKY